MDVGAVDVSAPRDDVLGVTESFHVGAELAPEDADEGVSAGGGADGAVQLRGAEAMEEAMVHGRITERAQSAAVGIGKNGFRAELLADAGELGRNLIESGVPRDAFEVLKILVTSALGSGL